MSIKTVSTITNSVMSYLRTSTEELVSPKAALVQTTVTDLFKQVREEQERAIERAKSVVAVLCNILYDLETPETLMMRLKASPYASELLTKVQEQRKKDGLPEVTVHFLTPEEIEKEPELFKGGGNVLVHEGIIRIVPTQSREERLQSLLFELANLSQRAEYDVVQQEFDQKRLTPLQAAIRLERIEFQSALLAKRITLHSVAKLHWSVSMLSTLFCVNTFAEWLDGVYSDDHMQRYVRYYETRRARAEALQTR